MIILKIILGILVFIVFLLSLPIDIKASYDVPKPSKKSNFPENSPQPNEYIPNLDDENDPDALYAVSYLKDNGLWPTPPKPEIEKVFSLIISYMFFKFTIFPMKDLPKKIKKEKVKPEKIKEKEQEEAETKSSRDWSFDDIINLWKKIEPKVFKLLKAILNNIRFHHVKIQAVLSAEDSTETALKFAHVNQALYSFLPIVLNYVKIRFTKIQIKPDFFSEHNDFSGQVSLRFNPIILLGAVLGFGLNLIIAMKSMDCATKKKM